MEDITGKKFNNLTAIKYIKSVSYHPYWLFKCDCGQEKIIKKCHVKANKIKSCGCKTSYYLSQSSSKHGMCSSEEYSTYLSMKDRCYNIANKRYKNYGGRGIKVCDRWLESFENFYNDMGKKPSKNYSIERIDNDGNYTPVNCKWILFEKQARNTTRSIRIKYKNKTKSLPQWCEDLNLNYNTIKARICYYKWEPKKAFEYPINHRGDVY